MSGISKKTRERTTTGRWIVKHNKALPAPHEDFLLPICIRGGDYHQGEQLAALMNALQGRCKNIFILISGVLYRNSLQVTDNLSAEEAQQVAYDEALAWEEKNKAIIESSLTPVIIVRWHDLLFSDTYDQQRGMLEEALANNDYSDGRAFFVEEAQRFLSRVKRRNENGEEEAFDPDHIDKSVKYIKEECAMFLALFKRFPDITKFVYPGQKSKAIQWTFDQFARRVEVVQPELTCTTGTFVKDYARKPLPREKVLADLPSINERANYWSRYGEVNASCRIFFLKGATSYTRGFLEHSIVAEMNRKAPGCELWRESCSKSTVLFFVQPGTRYSKENFFNTNSLWREYVPKHQKVMYQNPEINPIDQITKVNCVIILAPFENALLERNSSIPFNDLAKPLKSQSLTDNMQFVYSIMASRFDLPEMRFCLHIDNTVKRMRASFVDGAELDQQQKLVDFLIALRASLYLESAVEIDLKLHAGEIEFTNPQIWLALFYEYLKPKGSSVKSIDSNVSGVDSPILRAVYSSYKMPVLSLSSSSASASTGSGSASSSPSYSSYGSYSGRHVPLSVEEPSDEAVPVSSSTDGEDVLGGFGQVLFFAFGPPTDHRLDTQANTPNPLEDGYTSSASTPSNGGTSRLGFI